MRGVSSTSPSSLIENNEIPIHRTSFNTWREPTESPRRAVNRHSNPYNGSSNHSDDDATLAQCTQSVIPKVFRFLSSMRYITLCDRNVKEIK